MSPAICDADFMRDFLKNFEERLPTGLSYIDKYTLSGLDVYEEWLEKQKEVVNIKRIARKQFLEKFNFKDDENDVPFGLLDKFKSLISQIMAIESKFVGQLEGFDLPDNKDSYVTVTLVNSDFREELDGDGQFQWLVLNLEKLDKVFRKRVKKLEL